MIRTLATLTALTLGLSAARADELKGTLTKVNPAGHTLTVAVDGKDRTLPVSKDASFVSVTAGKGKKGKAKQKETPIAGGLGALHAGSAVTVQTDKAEARETVTSVKVTGDAKHPAKKKAKKAGKGKAKKKANKPNKADKANKKKANKNAKKGKSTD